MFKFDKNITGFTTSNLLNSVYTNTLHNGVVKVNIFDAVEILLIKNIKGHFYLFLKLYTICITVNVYYLQIVTRRYKQ
jgi:hypothetical protein